MSDVVTDAANMLERKYPHPDRITAAGLGEGEAFRPPIRRSAYRRIEANRPLPFADQAFDIAVSNAVLEHVGSVPHQAAFVRELSRVAKRVFISVPNRTFRSSTTPRSRCCISGRGASRWPAGGSARRNGRTKRNLILMSRQQSRGAGARRVAARSIGYTGIRLGPFSSNLFLYIDGSAGRVRSAG